MFCAATNNLNRTDTHREFYDEYDTKRYIIVIPWVHHLTVLPSRIRISTDCECDTVTPRSSHRLLIGLRPYEKRSHLITGRKNSPAGERIISAVLNGMMLPRQIPPYVSKKIAGDRTSIHPLVESRNEDFHAL